MTDEAQAGFEVALQYPLAAAIAQRRSRRISKGLKSVPAGSLSYTSKQDWQPLSLLEEAMLIAATGVTGICMPDRPFQDDTGEAILGSPYITMIGRAAGSPDNAQATHFFLINDTGTYFLKPPENVDLGTEITPEVLIERAEASKQLVRPGRLDFPREFPYYLDSNRFLSNLPGSTILLPVVDTTRQYINGLLYLLTQPDGFRPAIVDDRNFYQPAGVRKWIKNGYLNNEIKVPLSLARTFRTDIEPDLLLQNVMLTMQSMGLGGWIHASVTPPYLLGHPMYSQSGPGLGFRFATPKFNLLDLLRWGVPLPKVRANPVGLDGVLEGLCPPYVTSMSDAVDIFLEQKYGANGTYTDPAYFERLFRPGLAAKYLAEVPHYTDAAIQCVKDICTYIYETHGRFPAHVDAIHVPGIWIQAHHLDLEYYSTLFAQGFTDTHGHHEERWHKRA